MVAYSFNPRFEAPILAGTKCWTIRGEGRRRHARSGEMVQLYVGQRTRHCRLLGQAMCTDVRPIQIILSDAWGKPRIDFIDIDHERGPSIFNLTFKTREEIDQFARADGFSDGRDMAEFWWCTHRNLIINGQIQFNGLWIEWVPLGGLDALD